MPCIIECSECGYVFAEYERIPSPFIALKTSRWYDKLYKRFRGRCPRCKHKLPKPEGYAEKMKIKIVAKMEAK